MLLMAGFFIGGLVLIKTLEFNGYMLKIKEVYWSATCNIIVNGNPLKALFKIFIPMKRFYENERKTKYVETIFIERFHRT